MIIAVSVRGLPTWELARFTIAADGRRGIGVLPEFAHVIAVTFEEDLHGKLLG